MFIDRWRDSVAFYCKSIKMLETSYLSCTLWNIFGSGHALPPPPTMQVDLFNSLLIIVAFLQNSPESVFVSVFPCFCAITQKLIDICTRNLNT